MVRFDTFESLVQNNFKTLLPLTGLSKQEYSLVNLTLQVQNDYHKESHHEVFPFISKLLSDVWISIPRTE